MGSGKQVLMAAAKGIVWTNRSVKALAGGADPISVVEDAVRKLVLKAREKGWNGPPFNPIFLADMLNVRVEANSSISDARILQTERGPVIEFNPKQPRERVRFSIAHEIAHFLFPDWRDQVRNRGGSEHEIDEWQLEVLCNIAASEIVLPIGSMNSLSKVPPIEELMTKRREYDVSTEAFLIRLAKISTQPVGVFISSPRDSGVGGPKYFVDYFVGSPTAPTLLLTGKPVPENSVIRSCSAIGYTDAGTEGWLTGSPVKVECVGIPGFPGSLYPRVAGLVRFDLPEPDRRVIQFVHGSILEPRTGERRVICQLVNDKAVKWGGGVARQVSSKFPIAEAQFSESIQKIRQSERLGSVVFSSAEDGLLVASIVAQEGFGPSLLPRIRYEALEKGLKCIADKAIELQASVHMPRIGTGAAGGDWETVQEMIDEHMVRAGLKVIVYDRPPKRAQLELFD
jgi:O-acetyl-ADP-ribose deacetylase (regulator of RNase III)